MILIRRNRNSSRARQIEPVESRGREAAVETAAQRTAHCLGLLVNFFEHEVVERTFRQLLGDNVELRRLLDRRHRIERRHAIAARLDDGDLAVIEINRLLRVAHERGGIGGDEHFVVADAEDHCAAVTRNDDLLRMTRIHHRDAVGAGDRAQRRAHRVLERIGLDARNQLREHFGIGVGCEHDSAGFELRAQRMRVVDDAVVHDDDPARDVGVRVRVRIARRAVRRPARMADPDDAGKPLRQARLHVAHLALALVHGNSVLALQREPRRVIAAIFEPMQPLDQNRHRILMSDIANDSTHS